MDPTLLRLRIRTRLAATGKGPVTVSKAVNKGRDYLSNFLNGKKDSLAATVLPALAAELECTVDYLMNAQDTDAGDGRPDEALVPIRGYVGANPDARVRFATGDPTNDFALVPIGANSRATALYVDGHSMRDVADHGSLIFYEETRSPPTPDMLGHVVVVETLDGDVLIKRLLRGTRAGVYDLESSAAETMRDRRLRWAAHIISIVPPYQARRMIRRQAA